MRIAPSSTPAVSDPCWEAWAQPLYKFLAQPRTWRELKRWGKEHRREGEALVNTLAWMEERGKAIAWEKGEVFYWAQSLNQQFAIASNE